MARPLLAPPLHIDRAHGGLQRQRPDLRLRHRSNPSPLPRTGKTQHPTTLEAGQRIRFIVQSRRGAVGGRSSAPHTSLRGAPMRDPAIRYGPKFDVLRSQKSLLASCDTMESRDQTRTIIHTPPRCKRAVPQRLELWRRRALWRFDTPSQRRQRASSVVRSANAGTALPASPKYLGECK